MARFVLTPCKLREDRMVPSGAPVLTLDWAQLAAKLAPSKANIALMTLRRLRPTAFVGLLKAVPPKTGVSNFVLMNADRENKIGWLLKKQPDFPDRLVDLYLVEEALFDARMEEISSGREE